MTHSALKKTKDETEEQSQENSKRLDWGNSLGLNPVKKSST